ncbi:ribose-phosphate pyrophosphokinase [Clostridium cellulovorans]|uniref:ribose-phosphate diphosphokinase n=1 Tax=Clostridium cellulovorans (strain ATCC 35296 / DSM 3052 / OCM 3 / 743B) TaxID=573061 RepID=D9SVV0_CLOC7|nr:ribose-phosphate pyrophosphokinase [Clostridium cellulovorans]ADL53161.1 phosphoribosyltransferase [Clostridium cellulovorans 743B]
MLYLNNKIVEINKFPNGEALMSCERFNLRDDLNEVKLNFQGDEDITHLFFLKNHLDNLGVKCNLVIPYMPYSRMDRTEGITVFTLKYFCKLINSLNFCKVVIYEPHSDVSVALLDRIEVIDMSKLLAEKALNEIGSDDENVYLVYPDAGAAKRYGKQINYEKVLTARKERDFKTGDIKNLIIDGSTEGKNFKAIIVDDLCSRGGTFIYTAEKLKALGAREIYLVVTHCENTIFQGDILKNDLITKVYTTDSILSKEHEKIAIYRI